MIYLFLKKYKLNTVIYPISNIVNIVIFNYYFKLRQGL